MMYKVYKISEFKVGDHVKPAFPARRVKRGRIAQIDERGYYVQWDGVGGGDGWDDEDLQKA